MGSSVDEAWAELQRLSEPSSGTADLARMMDRLSAKVKSNANPTSRKAAGGAAGRRGSMQKPVGAVNVPSKAQEELVPREEAALEVVLARIRRCLQGLQQETGQQRRRSFIALHNELFPAGAKNEAMGLEIYQELLDAHFKAIFKGLADPVEQCREMAIRLSMGFFSLVPDLTPYLAYFFPALMARVPDCFGYDAELQVFVKDVEEHEAYKRGKATYRQDKVAPGEALGTKVVEPSEELRLLLCQLLGSLISTLLDRGAGPVIHPYFHETVLFFQSQLHDPFPDVRIEACSALQVLAGTHVYELGMKYYAVALVRALLPSLRHRLAKARVAAVDAVRAVVQVPNRDKRKGAGTEAIIDLVGFREDNVLPIGAFYRPEISINYLAEISQDSNAAVRKHTLEMLADWLVNLPDRYDYEMRLCPYLLHFLTDPVEAHRDIALAAVLKCGELYEGEHQDDIIDRRQYGVDGDRRCNHADPLPHPFTTRPRLGARLYVRGATRRILRALLEELCNWISKTRLRSATLLRTLVIFHEEHLVSDFHVVLPFLYRALHLARSEGDAELCAMLLECDGLLGRFVLPETYAPLITARLRQDPLETPHGLDEAHKAAVVGVLAAMLGGSLPRELLPHAQSLVEALADEEAEAPALWRANAEGLGALLGRMGQQAGGGKAVVEAHFMSTGRLHSLSSTLYRAFRFLLLCRARADLQVAEAGMRLLGALIMLEGGGGAGACVLGQMLALFGDKLVGDWEGAGAGAGSSSSSSTGATLDFVLGAPEAAPWVAQHSGRLTLMLCSSLREEAEGGDTEGMRRAARQLLGCLRQAAAHPSGGADMAKASAQVLQLCLDAGVEGAWGAGEGLTALRLSLMSCVLEGPREGLLSLKSGVEPAAIVKVAAEALRERKSAVEAAVGAIGAIEGVLRCSRPAKARLGPAYSPQQQQPLCEVAAEGVEALLACLDHSDQGVASRACTALREALFHVSLDDLEHPQLGYRAVLRRCLNRLALLHDSCGQPAQQELLDGLDALLRVAAVLAPRVFVTAVEQDGGSQRDVHDLIGHAELLMSLTGASD